MDGNRGAKGSIKDRLISLLYRLRYAKKVKKEDEYTIAQKEKQVEYLKKMLDLQENENVDILDSSDKKELDKVKFNVNYKLDKKGINIVDYELFDIESKTNELNEKVNIKEEIKKVKNEVVILEEVNLFIENSKALLEEIDKDVEELKVVSKEKNQDTKKIEERYNELREKVEKLKKQYDVVSQKYDLSEFSVLESIKLIYNIDEYKSRANLNELDMMVKVCKKEINKIEKINIEYAETQKVETTIENVKEDQKNIKICFKKSEEQTKELINVEEKIETEIKSQEEIIEEMYKEASYIKKITQKELVNTGSSRILSSLLRIAGGILTLPFSGSKIFGVALGNTMINRGLKMLNQSFEYEEKITYKYEYTDIAHKISEVKDKVEYTSLIISDNLNEISKLKENLEKYKEYDKVLNKYESLFNKVNNLESRLKLQQEKILQMDKKLDEEKEINNQKMKKVIMNKNYN